MKHHQSGWPVRYSRTIHVRDSDFTELSQLMEELPEEARKQVQDKSPVLSRLVLCEELLIEYAENGYTEMEVLLRSFFRHSSILIRIPGEKGKRWGRSFSFPFLFCCLYGILPSGDEYAESSEKKERFQHLSRHVERH